MIFDAHLDLSFNAITYNRDLRMPVERLREIEDCETVGAVNAGLGGWGRGTVAFPEMRSAGIGLCVATQLAGCMKPAAAGGGWNSPEQAWAMTQGQLAWYHAMERCGALRQIVDLPQLDEQLAAWSSASDRAPIGFVLSLEGADSLRTLDDLETAYRYGLRALGPAHYGAGRYAPGHDLDGLLTDCGRSLLAEMSRLNLILDVTHLCEPSFWQALELFQGSVWASHHNCRALVDDPRQLSDRQILALAERDAVIGVAFDIWMGVPNWRRGTSSHDNTPGATMHVLADHVEHICQVTSSMDHVGIGTDLDGGFGAEQSPADVNTIADVPKLFDILASRGYRETDIAKLSHGNFLRVLRNAWS